VQVFEKLVRGYPLGHVNICLVMAPEQRSGHRKHTICVGNACFVHPERSSESTNVRRQRFGGPSAGLSARQDKIAINLQIDEH